MKWLLKVPKILHVYWGGGVLPYIRFMTVKSFLELNPEWKIMFWYPKYPSTVPIPWKTGELDYKVTCTDYLPELFKLPIQSTEIDFEEYGFRNDLPESAKSDFIRYHLLFTIGGVWSDMDILYFRPIFDLGVNTFENRDKETFVCVNHYGHSNGFLMSAIRSTFFARMEELSKDGYNADDYQSLGPSLCNKYYGKLASINKISSVVNIGISAVYSHDANHIYELLSEAEPRFIYKSIGVHWYAGSPIWKDFIENTNGGLINLGNNIIGNLLTYGFYTRR